MIIFSDAEFAKKASGSPSELIQTLAKEIKDKNKSNQISNAMQNGNDNFRMSKDKLHPIALISSQKRDTFNYVDKDLNKVKIDGITRLQKTDSCSSLDVFSVNSDSSLDVFPVDSDSSVASYKPPRSRQINFDDMNVDSDASSRGKTYLNIFIGILISPFQHLVGTLPQLTG